ncbi:MAG: hypothetical protein HOF21_13900 [Nitrospina sp.]|nr:hypothetical protein [Nitrospina sp.]MBT5631881.1 hypothetical protein [Nitrospina sp.]
MIKTSTLLLIITCMTACSSAPEITPGKGAIYGTISAESHKAILAKASKKKNGIYGSVGGLIFTNQMVNYPKLKELFVCLLDPSSKGGNEHLLIATNDNMSLSSLAVGTGDRLTIQNDSSETLTFFLAGKEEDIQVYSPVKPGERSSLVLELEGDLELGSDENESLQTILLSRRGLIGQQHSSGDQYVFENLHPGQYKFLFWYWRLGLVEKNLIIKAGENIELNQVLSVDKILESKNEP